MKTLVDCVLLTINIIRYNIYIIVEVYKSQNLSYKISYFNTTIYCQRHN